MIAGKSILAIIPTRLGSKRLKQKNIMIFKNKYRVDDNYYDLEEYKATIFIKILGIPIKIKSVHYFINWKIRCKHTSFISKYIYYIQYNFFVELNSPFFSQDDISINENSEYVANETTIKKAV